MPENAGKAKKNGGKMDKTVEEKESMRKTE